MGLCQGIIGNWEIWADFPEGSQQLVNWQWENENWQSAQGDGYTVETVTSKKTEWQQYGNYYLQIRATGGNIGNQPIDQVWGYTYNGVYGVRIVPFYQHFPSYGYAVWQCRRETKDANGNWINRGTTVSVCHTGSIYINQLIRNNVAINLNVYTKTIKVLDKNLQVLATDTRTKDYTEPGIEITQEGEGCKYKNRWKKIRDYYNSNRSSYVTTTVSGNCVYVFAWNKNFDDGEFFPITLAYLCSDGSCEIPPKIDVRCEHDCKNKKCPKGTKAKILHNKSIICCDKNGCITKVIPYDPECENPNCRC